jgi:hypothetical protein
VFIPRLPGNKQSADFSQDFAEFLVDFAAAM